MRCDLVQEYQFDARQKKFMHCSSKEVGIGLGAKAEMAKRTQGSKA
jgi:hypothetical protein